MYEEINPVPADTMPCPETARKHLNAAFVYAKAYMRSASRNCEEIETTGVRAKVSAAWVFLAEAAANPKYLDLADGMLVAAEDTAASLGISPDAVRECRFKHPDRLKVMKALEQTGLVNPMLGHLFVAWMEGGPSFPSVINADYVIHTFVRCIEGEARPKWPDNGRRMRHEGEL